jgi:hypothetical protein
MVSVCNSELGLSTRKRPTAADYPEEAEACHHHGESVGFRDRGYSGNEIIEAYG